MSGLLTFPSGGRHLVAVSWFQTSAAAVWAHLWDGLIAPIRTDRTFSRGQGRGTSPAT